MIEDLEDFIDAFDEVKLLNWVQTHRSGPTGVGKTLEDLLEIPTILMNPILVSTN